MGTGRGKHRVKQFSMAGWLRAIGVSHWETGYAGENLSSQRCGFCMPLLWSEKCIATIYIYLIIFYKYVVIQSIFTVLYIYIHWGCILRGIWISEKQPLAATRVAASGRSVEWPQMAAFDAWPRYLNLRKSSHLEPLAATRVAASGREWPPLPHNVMNSKLRKTPTRSRRQPTYPSQLEKNTFPTKHIFSRCSKTIAKKHNLTWTKTKKNTHSQPPTWKKTPTHSRWLKKRRVPS